MTEDEIIDRVFGTSDCFGINLYYLDKIRECIKIAREEK